MKSFFSMGCIAALLFAWAAPANAATVDLTFQSVSPGQITNVNLTRGGSTIFNGRVRAGVFNFLDSSNHAFQTFCIDLNEYVRRHHAVNYTIETDLTAAPLTSTGGNQTISAGSALLLSEFFGETVAPLDLTSINSTLGAAIGLVTWELAHEDGSSGYDLTSGDFRATASSATMNTANSLLASVLDQGSDANADMIALVNAGWQDQLTFVSQPNDGDLIPTPAGAGMGMVGLAMVAIRRRRRA